MWRSFGCCNRLTVLPQRLVVIVGLEQLDLRCFKQLEALPERLGDLTLLKQLDLKECPELMVLPERLGILTGLEKLNLQGCSGLMVLPEGLRDLTGLIKLNLEMCVRLTVLSERKSWNTNMLFAIKRKCNRLTQSQMYCREQAKNWDYATVFKQFQIGSTYFARPMARQHHPNLMVGELGIITAHCTTHGDLMATVDFLTHGSVEILMDLNFIHPLETRENWTET